MTTTLPAAASSTTGSGGPPWGRDGGASWSRWLHRHGVRLLISVVLIGVGGTVCGVLVARTDPRVPVLVTARSVAAGTRLSPADLRQARVAADASLQLIPARQRSSVLGTVVPVPLRAGQVLTRTALSGPAWPGAGHAVVAVSVKAGQYPPSITAGSTVEVVFTAGPNTAAGADGSPADGTPASVTAVVTSVHAGGARDGSAVVELRLPTAGARQVVAAAAVTVMAVSAR